MIPAIPSIPAVATARHARARNGEQDGMSNASRKWPFAGRRCTRCTKEAAVVVEGEGARASVAACVEHLEWAFLLDVDEWSGRRRAA